MIVNKISFKNHPHFCFHCLKLSTLSTVLFRTCRNCLEKRNDWRWLTLIKTKYNDKKMSAFFCFKIFFLAFSLPWRLVGPWYTKINALEKKMVALLLKTISNENIWNYRSLSMESKVWAFELNTPLHTFFWFSFFIYFFFSCVQFPLVCLQWTLCITDTRDE